MILAKSIGVHNLSLAEAKYAYEILNIGSKGLNSREISHLFGEQGSKQAKVMEDFIKTILQEETNSDQARFLY